VLSIYRARVQLTCWCVQSCPLTHTFRVFMQWRITECFPKFWSYDLCTHTSLLLSFLSSATLIVFTLLLSTFRLSLYLL
jgi:hypothetical protein